MTVFARPHRGLLFILLATLFAARSVSAAQTVLTYVSEPGDYIGGGEEATFTPADGTFVLNPTYANGQVVSFNTPTYSHWWSLYFGAADGQVLVAGTYENAERFAFKSPGHPGIDFTGDGRGCNTIRGRFDLREIERDAAGTVVKLAIDFEQHCEGMGPGLFGQVRYNSDVPLSPKPLSVRLVNPLNYGGCVEATGGRGALINVVASEVHDAQGGQQLKYSWTASTGATGSTPEFKFQAPIGLAPANIALSVLDLTNGTTRTATKSVCVSDTTPPRITILRPRPGELVHEDNVVLEVQIDDIADKNITSYEADLGLHVVSPLNPRTGYSRQRLQEAPRTDGPVPTTITVRTQDASGNFTTQTVTFSEIFDSRRPGH